MRLAMRGRLGAMLRITGQASLLQILLWSARALICVVLVVGVARAVIRAFRQHIGNHSKASHLPHFSRFHLDSSFFNSISFFTGINCLPRLFSRSNTRSNEFIKPPVQCRVFGRGFPSSGLFPDHQRRFPSSGLNFPLRLSAGFSFCPRGYPLSLKLMTPLSYFRY